ncbi:Oligouridylate-binding protein 1B [Striga hermonthica]|uniref:Oligouridylate-binding protein 1B n=1 Tax=Striga hermonthica TaxID=68872 RepID=A0A9N7N9N7_STRHE|nr:Oligouridylate-binding protein 1B [Striga hermonthica]
MWKQKKIRDQIFNFLRYRPSLGFSFALQTLNLHISSIDHLIFSDIGPLWIFPSLYHPGLFAAPQIEPMAHGNLPPGFDPGTCLSVYVGNLHIQTTEPLLQEVFARAGPVKSCKLVRQKNSSYGFVHYFDYRSPARAITYLNRSYLFEQPIKVDYAYTRGQREDTSGHYNIFVGNLSAEVTDAVLFECFSVYPSCSDARVMWDQKTGLSRGFGFVSFRSQQNAQNAINDLTGKWLGSRQIRCTWAKKGAGKWKQ